MSVSDFLMCNTFLRKHDIYSSENTEQYFSYKSCTFESTGNSSFGPVVAFIYCTNKWCLLYYYESLIVVWS